jgi:hypothetical protein
MESKKQPLGYIKLLNNTEKAVYPMDDFFINFAFHKKENWGHLREMLNIFFNSYQVKYQRQDGFHFIGEKITVETQYEHYIRMNTKQPAQDARIQEQQGGQTFVEFQNKATTRPPISIRASNYFGLAINKAEGGAEVSQVWLLAENDDQVLLGQVISNFRMIEDNTGGYYPREMNIMFVSLPRLAEELGLGGELAQMMLGKPVSTMSSKVRGIWEMFQREYDHFKENEEVVKSMTILEERYTEGRFEGETEGIAKGKAEGRAEGKAEGRAEGRAEGKVEGKAEGRAERDMEIAQSLFARVMDTAEATRTLKELGISDEIIEAARKQQPDE